MKDLLNVLFYSVLVVCGASLLLVIISSWGLRRARRKAEQQIESLRAQEERRQAKRKGNS